MGVPSQVFQGGGRPFDDAELTGWLESVADAFAGSELSGLDRRYPGAERRWFLGQHRDRLHDPATSTFVECSSGSIAATTSWTAKPMETELLGVSAAALSTVVTDPATPEPDAVIRLLRAACDSAAGAGTEVVFLRVSGHDPVTLWAAQQAGFSVVESAVTWSGTHSESPLESDDTRIEVIELAAGDARPALDVDAVGRFRDATGAWPLSRFRVDQGFDEQAIEAYYGRWIDNIAAGRWGDVLYVAWRDGRPVALFNESTDGDLFRHASVTRHVGGWMMVLEAGGGLAGLLFDTAAGRSTSPPELHEWETQSHNLQTMRAMQRARGMDVVRSTFTLHRWLEAP